jgi:hypothetical protein
MVDHREPPDPAKELRQLRQQGPEPDKPIVAPEIYDLLTAEAKQHYQRGPEGWQAPSSNGAAKPLPSMPMTLAQLLSLQDEPYDWLIDWLLERLDRFFLTGKEGGGKSTLLRQIGIAAAAGLHPFTFDPLPRTVRVLCIDCENSKRQLGREFDKQLLPLGVYPPEDVLERFFVEMRTEGLVLDDPRDREGDRFWLEGVVAQCKPELVTIGPIYKLIGGVANDEEPNRELALLFDRLRIKYNFTIAIEGHSPHGEIRPYGWSGWSAGRSLGSIWRRTGRYLDGAGTGMPEPGRTDWRAAIRMVGFGRQRPLLSLSRKPTRSSGKSRMLKLTSSGSCNKPICPSRGMTLWSGLVAVGQ